MPRIINGVAYSEDYEVFHGAIPKGPAHAKTVTTNTGSVRTVNAPVENTQTPVETQAGAADGSGVSAR